MSKDPVVQDLGLLPEDERIAVMAERLREGATIAFIVEDDAKKADRYLAKLRERVPSLTVLSYAPLLGATRSDGVTAFVVKVRAQPS